MGLLYWTPVVDQLEQFAGFLPRCTATISTDRSTDSKSSLKMHQNELFSPKILSKILRKGHSSLPRPYLELLKIHSLIICAVQKFPGVVR